MMKMLPLAAIGLSSSLVFAQDFNLISNTDNFISFEHSFTEKEYVQTEINNQLFVDFDKTFAITMKDAGAPALPTFAESVIVPNKGKVTLSVDYDNYTTYENVDIAPSKGSLKRNVNPSEVPYLFGDVYAENEFYPADIATLSEPFNLRETRGITVQFSPYQYNPVTKTLRVYHNVTANIMIDGQLVGQNELFSKDKKSNVYNEVYSNFYLNAIGEKYTPVEEDGELLIITADQFEDKLDSFVRWKIESGIKTTVVNMTTVGSTDSDVLSYVQDFYNNNPDFKYLLFVGDHSGVPSHTYGSSGWEELWSDSYYGQLVGGSNDFYPEIFVGRFSANTDLQLSTQIDRVLEYEKNPAAGDWMTKAIGLASDEGAGYGDDGEADWQHARNNRTKLMDFGYTTVYEFYDGSHGGEDASGNPSSTIISPAVNDGVGLFNYTGHGDQNTCITGNYGSSHINYATNDGKYPVVISVACNNGTFTSGTCISETWAWARNNQSGSPTGAINACGSTILMAWAEPMQTQDEMTDIIAESYVNNRKATIGGIFYNSQMSTLEEYNNSATAKEVMQTWVMFGDPTVLFRNKVTMDMNVTHVGNVPLGTTSVDVNCDVEGARITIVQNGSIIGTGNVSGGVATITFDALVTNEPLIVTGIKQNYRPYQGEITVADGPSSDLGIDDALLQNVSIFPNPANDILNLQWDKDLTVSKVSMLTIAGQEVFNTTTFNNSLVINTSSLNAGVYFVNIEANGTNRIEKVIIE